MGLEPSVINSPDWGQRVEVGDLQIASMFNIFAHKYLSCYLLFFHITKSLLDFA